MAEQKKMNWTLIGLAAILAIAICAYIAKPIMERKMADEIAEALANLPGGFTVKAESITVDAFKESVALRNISGSGQVGGKTMTIGADSAEGVGLDIDAFKQKGVSTLAESLVVRNLKLSGAGVDGRVALYRVEKLRGDFAAIAVQTSKMLNVVEAKRAAMGRDAEAVKRANDELLAIIQTPEFNAAMGTLYIGLGVAEGYDFRFDLADAGISGLSSMRLVMDSSEGRDYSISHYGPVVCRGLKIDLNNAPLLTVDEIGMKGMELPDNRVLLNMDKADGETSLKDFKMALKGLYLRKLDMILPSRGNEKIGLAGFDLNLALDDKLGLLDFKLDKLDLASTLLLAGSPLPPSVRNHLPERLTFGGEGDIVVALKENSMADVSVKKLGARAPQIGSAIFSCEFTDIDTAGGDSETRVRSMDFSATDDGGVKTALMLVSAMQGGVSEAELIAQIEAQRDTLPGKELKDLNMAVTSFLKWPGSTIRVKVAPEIPVTAQEFQLMLLLGPEKLGLSSSFIPVSNAK